MIATIADQIFYAVSVGSVYCLVALGLTLLLSVVEIVNFAHGEIAMIGAYVVYIIFIKFGMPFILAIGISVVSVAILSLIIERVLIRPIKGDLLNSMLVTIGLAYILQVFAVVQFGGLPKGYGQILAGAISVFGSEWSLQRIMVLSVSLVLMGLLLFIVYKTKLGLAMRAVSQNLEVASLMGVCANRVSSASWMVAGSLAAIAGVMLGVLYAVEPFMGTEPTLKAFIIVILGGLGSVGGAILGAYIIAFIETFASTLWSHEIAMIIAFCLVIGIVQVRPKGLIGHE